MSKKENNPGIYKLVEYYEGLPDKWKGQNIVVKAVDSGDYKNLLGEYSYMMEVNWEDEEQVEIYDACVLPANQIEDRDEWKIIKGITPS